MTEAEKMYADMMQRNDLYLKQVKADAAIWLLPYQIPLAIAALNVVVLYIWPTPPKHFSINSIIAAYMGGWLCAALCLYWRAGRYKKKIQREANETV
jgi:hypothetical protein